MQNILNNPTMMQQAFNGFMTSMIPAMMPQMMAMFANQMQNNLNQMCMGNMGNANQSLEDQFDNSPPTVSTAASSKKSSKFNSQVAQSPPQVKAKESSKQQQGKAGAVKFVKITLYNFFTKKKFKDIKASNPELSFSEVSAKVAAEYKQLSEKDRANLQKQVDEENQVKLQEFQKNGGVVADGGRGRETTVKGGGKAPAKPEKDISDKKPMTPFMFYMQVRRAELRDPQHVSADKIPGIKEVTQIVSAEWRQLDEFKKK